MLLSCFFGGGIYYIYFIKNDILTVTFLFIFLWYYSHCSLRMADRKGKAVNPIKMLSKKEQEELKKKVRRLGKLH